MPGHSSIRGLSVLDVDPSLAAPSVRPTPGFDELYAGYFDLVLRLVRRWGVAPSWVEDAVQEVFLVVHRRLPGFEGRSSVKTWLVGITFRVAKDFRRRAVRKGGAEPLQDTHPDPGLDPEQRASVKEAAMIVDAFLEGLDEDRRAVFVLAELEGWTVPEIAESLSVNLNTTYSRLRLARRDFEAYVAQLPGGGR